jgi:Kef-type K+ transport system membrane component KefB
VFQDKSKAMEFRITAPLLLLALFSAAICAEAQEALPTETGAVVAGDKVLFSLHASVGSISPAERAAIVNRRIERILTEPGLEPQFLATQPQPNGNVRLILRDFALLDVTEGDARAESMTREELAQDWAHIARETLTIVKPIYRPAHEEKISFLPLVLVSSLAFLVPLLAARFRRVALPVVVGEILVGILIGRSGLELVSYHSWLQFLAEFGFAYLMFLSGLEVDFSLLRPASGGTAPIRKHNPLLLAGVSFGITLLLAGGVAFGLTLLGYIKQPLMMVLVLSTTSLGLTVPILKERGLTSSLFGQTLLLAALIADFVTMFLITITAGWIASGPTLKLFLGLALFGIFLLALRVGRLLLHSPKINRLWEGISHATQAQVRGSLALMLAFVALSEQLGTEVILGAFLAGMLLSLFTDRTSSDLYPKLEALGFGFFIPIFFIMVGVRFDLSAVVSTTQGLVLTALLVVGAFVIKLGSALVFRSIVSWRETLAGGFLLSARLSLIIAAAEIGLRLGLLTDTVHAAIICVALVTCIGGPVGFQLLMPRPLRERRSALIGGAGEPGILLAEHLLRRGYEVTLMDANEAALDAAQAAGLRVIEGDGTDAQDLRQAGIEETDTFIAVTSSDAVNEAMCRTAGEYGVRNRLAFAYQPETARQMQAQGIIAVIPALSTIVMIEGLLSHPAIFGAVQNGTNPE